jgi:hypothetical protein
MEIKLQRRVFISSVNVYCLVTFRKSMRRVFCLLAYSTPQAHCDYGVLLGIVLSPIEHTAIAQKQSKRYLSISYPTRPGTCTYIVV